MNVPFIVLIHNRLFKSITAETVDLVFKKVIISGSYFIPIRINGNYTISLPQNVSDYLPALVSDFGS